MSIEAPGRYRWRLAALSLAMLLPSLGTSIANVALPTIAGAFGASNGDAQWVVIAYLLAVTTLVVVVGRLSDTLGRRRLLLAGIGLFATASIAAMFASSLGAVVGLRAAQGAGAAAMLALTMASVGDMVPRERTGAAMGLLGTVSAVGTALGPSVGGAVLSAFGWPAVFGVMGLAGIATWLFGYALFPRDRPSAGTTRLDVWGTLTLAASLCAYALAATIDAGSWGTAGLWVAAGLGTCSFVAIEARAHAPLVELRLLTDPMLRAGLASLGLVSAILMSTLVVGPFYLSQVLSLSPLGVGLVMSVGPAVAAMVGIPAGVAVDRLGASRATLLGLVALLVGTVLMVALPAACGTAGYVVSLAAITSGYGLFQTANNTSIMARAGAERRGVISAMLALARNLGLITGASAMGAIFAVASVGVPGLPAGGEAGLQVTFGICALLTAAAIAINVVAGNRRRGDQ